MFAVSIGNHDRVHPLVLVTVYDSQGGGFFMCIYAFDMRFATRPKKYTFAISVENKFHTVIFGLRRENIRNIKLEN